MTARLLAAISRLGAAKASQSLEVASVLSRVPSSRHLVIANVVAQQPRLSEGRMAETKADWLVSSAGEPQLLAARLESQF